MKKYFKFYFVSVFFLFGFAASVQALDEKLNPNKKIVYVYTYDKKSANSFKDFLDANDFQVELLRKDSLPRLSRERYYCVIIGPEVGYRQQDFIQRISNILNVFFFGFRRAFPEDWNTSFIQPIVNTHSPILGLGEGGFVFFGKLALNIGNHGALGSSTHIIPTDSKHSIWNNPNRIILNAEGKAIIYKKEQKGRVIHKRYIDSTNESLGMCQYEWPLNSLVVEKSFYILWGYEGSPSLMTDDGKRLFLNTIKLIGTFEYGNKNR